MSVNPSPAGVLLLHHGGPRDEAQVPAFLASIAHGRPLAPEVVAEYRRRYRLYGGSPLPLQAERLGAALRSTLQARLPGCVVAVGAMHGEPSLAAAVNDLAGRGAGRVAAIVLVPQYSAVTVGRYLCLLDEALRAAGRPFEPVCVRSWATQPLLVESIAQRLRQSLAGTPAEDAAGLPVVFTAHSVPTRSLAAGDPFEAELLATSAAVARRAGLVRWRLAYQSAGRAPGPWLGPSVGEAVEALAATGESRALVAPIHFLFDNLETLYDLDVVLRGQAEELGIQILRCPALNDSPLLVDALAELALAALP